MTWNILDTASDTTKRSQSVAFEGKERSVPLLIHTWWSNTDSTFKILGIPVLFTEA